MPHLYFYFFRRVRHWTSHIPASSAPSEQVLNQKQRTTSVVTVACISNCFFVCLLLKDPLSFHDLTVSARTHISHFTADRYQHVNTERQGEVCYFFCSFSYRREIWFFLSATQSEVQPQLGLCSLCRSLTRKQDGWWLAMHCKPDFSQANCFPVWHSCLSKGFKLPI